MPVYLRRFVFEEMKQFYEEEKAANEKAMKKTSRAGRSSETQTFDMNAPKGKSPVKYQ